MAHALGGRRRGGARRTEGEGGAIDQGQRGAHASAAGNHRRGNPARRPRHAAVEILEFLSCPTKIKTETETVTEVNMQRAETESVHVDEGVEFQPRVS
jgi:hypothetical protein